MQCPRCAVELVDISIEGQSSFACKSCKGVLIHQNNLVAILESLSRNLFRNVSLNEPINPVKDEFSTIDCPQCQKAMTRHGYMETKEVIIDTCFDCQLLWADPKELSGMALIYTRLKLREEDAARRIHSSSVDPIDLITAGKFTENWMDDWF